MNPAYLLPEVLRPLQKVVTSGARASQFNHNRVHVACTLQHIAMIEHQGSQGRPIHATEGLLLKVEPSLTGMHDRLIIPVMSCINPNYPLAITKHVRRAYHLRTRDLVARDPRIAHAGVV